MSDRLHGVFFREEEAPIGIWGGQATSTSSAKVLGYGDFGSSPNVSFKGTWDPKFSGFLYCTLGHTWETKMAQQNRVDLEVFQKGHSPVSVQTTLKGCVGREAKESALLTDPAGSTRAWTGVQLPTLTRQFLSRMVLFEEGLILTTAAQNTFTGQVLKFLSQLRMLYFKKALVLSLDALDHDDDLVLPLNRWHFTPC